MRELLRAIWRRLRMLTARAEEFIDVGDQVVVAAYAASRQRQRSGVDGGVRSHLSWSTLRDGKIARCRVLPTTVPKPSKPSGCRSKTLTPTPEPAGYCAGDVAGERGGRRRQLDDARNRGDFGRYSDADATSTSMASSWTADDRDLIGSHEAGGRSESVSRTGSRHVRPRLRFERDDRRPGDRVVLVDRIDGRARAAGSPVDAASRRTSTRFATGKIVRVEVFRDRAEALEAVGPLGVGDVAGERGDRAAAHRGRQPRRPASHSRTARP